MALFKKDMPKNVRQSTQLVSRNPLEIQKSGPVGCAVSVVDLSGYMMEDMKVFNPEGYTILCRVGETCNGLTYFPGSSTVILNSNQQSQLFNNFDQLIPGISQDLQVSPELALAKTKDFFSSTEVRVIPVGIQGKVFYAMRGLQNIIPMSYTMNALSAAKTAGITGFKIVRSAPLTCVGASYVGAVFFSYAGSVAGNNTVGLVLNGTSYVLSRPMWAVEQVVNGLFLGPVSNFTGLPMVLNGTEELLKGQGLSIQSYTKIGLAFERIVNSTVFKKGRKIYKIIRNKDDSKGDI